jgi:hypothetical protein
VSPRVSRTLPAVEPILLIPRRDLFDLPGRLFEPKFDGYRGLLYVTRKNCHFRPTKPQANADRCGRRMVEAEYLT